ncbi:MAG: amidohydrolase [bacterium]|jgi:amidohydrolase|nr:amidohydrolase [candidate division KSB1 bacterium]MDH7559427.1 amidohydrolase [bacterium]
MAIVGEAHLVCCLVSVVGLLLAYADGAEGRPRGAKPSTLGGQIDRLAAEVQEQVIAWRRDFHRHPELSNREFRTAGVVAAELQRLGLEVRTGVAHTGVVGLLRGAKDSPVVALRADMDALPVTEELDLPFASRVRTTFRGQEVGVMHACGHDAHMAMLLGAAAVLSRLRAELPGTVKFIFQPAEEGAPEGEQGGAAPMIAEGVLENPAPSAIFGLHVFPFPAGTIAYCPGPAMAAVDELRITVKGRQTHGAAPWRGVDPVVVSAQIILGLQTIVSRQINLTEAPAIVTIGSIHGGVRNNIIPEQVELWGTIRSFGEQTREDLHRRITRTATSIAEAAGATAQVQIIKGYPVLVNDPDLTKRMVPVLRQVSAGGEALQVPPKTTAEDFAYYAQRIPGLFFNLGVAPRDADPDTVAENHSPRFFVDESALVVGVRALAHLAASFLEMESKK